jgi:hypothetical protein
MHAQCHMAEGCEGESILPKPWMNARSIATWMDHSQEAVVFDQTEILSPNATVYVRGGRTKYGHGSDDRQL